MNFLRLFYTGGVRFRVFVSEYSFQSGSFQSDSFQSVRFRNIHFRAIISEWSFQSDRFRVIVSEYFNEYFIKLILF
jgi:hypothetical protein